MIAAVWNQLRRAEEAEPGEHARMAEHRANDTASITLSGNVRLRLPDHDAELPAGRLVVLERGLRHAVEAVAESAFLLTLGRQAK